MTLTPALELVAYQPGSVVSKVILKNPGGTVTAFAFDAGEGLSEHTAPFDALVHIIEGEASITIGAEPHHVRAGDLLTLPATIPHAVKAVTPFKMILTMIKA
jgi:quercetin dioxygenase-like cupin family protein